jgi:hypothetical protein
VGEEHWVVLFDSIHYVLAAERVLRRHGVWHDLVPTPRRLSSDCGMAIEFRPPDLKAVHAALAEPGVRWRGVYRPAAEGYEEVES